MSKLRLDDVEWGEFNIGGEFGIFKVGGTITTHPSNLKSSGNTPRVTCSATNNAVENFYCNIPTEKGGVLTVDSATEGYVSYQLNDFIATDHVEKIFLEDKKINKFIGLFLKSCIDKSKLGKYGYGYKFSQKRISRQKIMLPIDSKGNPNWQFMEDYVKQEMKEQSQKVVSYYENKLLKLAFELLDLEVEWKEFKIKYIFEVYTGRDIIISKLKEGKYPVVTHSLENNGIQFFSSKIENRRLFNHKTTISLADRGNFVAYVHPNDFYIGTRVKALSLKEEKDSYILHFLTIVINNQRVRFSYGYNATNKVADMKIMLPTDKNGTPYWEYMGKFVKNLEKENIEKVLEYIYIYIT